MFVLNKIQFILSGFFSVCSVSEMVQKHRFKGGNARLLREAKVGQNTFSF